MNVEFYRNFSKRLNSTKRPSSSGTIHDCKLKENCSMHDPVLLLASQQYTYEYAKITWTGDTPMTIYYFVTDVISRANGLVEYHLTEDVLASYKDDIGGTSAHIVFSSSDYDPYIIDSRIHVKNSKVATGSTDIQDRPVFSGGGYILSVFGGDLTVYSTGLSVSYWLDDNAMQVCRTWLSDQTAWGGLVSMFAGHTPKDAMLGLIWVPYTIPEGYLIETDKIYVGSKNNQDYGFYFSAQHKPYIIKGFQMSYGSFKIPIHLRYTDFRAFEPYTTGVIFLPGVGNLDLNMGDWKGSEYINVSVSIELITGNVKYLLTSDAGNLIQSAECNVAAICPLGQITTNAAGVMTGLGTIAGGVAALAATAATEGAALPMAMSASSIIAGAANTAMSANQHGVSISGGFGGRTVTMWPYIHHVEYSIDTEDPTASSYIALRGRPCNGCRTIGNLSGYVLCEGASIVSAALGSEKDEINRFLNSGFYYE